MVKYCQYCGAKLADDAVFCDECGKSIYNDSLNKSMNNSNNDSFVSKIFYKKDGVGNKRINKLSIGIIVVIIILIVGALVVASGALVPKTTCEFHDFSLTIPSDYQASESSTSDSFTNEKPYNVKIVNKDGLYVGVVYKNEQIEGKLDINSYKKSQSNDFGGVIREETIGGRHGFINEIKSDNMYAASFTFEDNGNIYTVSVSNATILTFAWAGTYDDLVMLVEGFKAKSVSPKSTNSIDNNENTYTCKAGGVKFVIPSEGHDRDGVAIRFTYSGINCEIEEVPENEQSTDTRTFYEASFSKDYQGGEPYTLVVNNHPWTGVKIYKDGKWFHISMNTDDVSEAEKLVSWMNNHNTWSSP